MASAPRIREAHLTVARTARYHVLGELHEGLRQVWIACHGYGQLAERFLATLEPAASRDRLLVAPEGLSRFYLNPEAGRVPHAKVGASWMTREDREHEIADQVAYLDALLDTVTTGLDRDRVEVVAFGFSQGVATVCRWLARGRARADRLILWGGLVPPEIDLADASGVLRTLPVTLVAGEDDQFATREAIDAQEVALRTAGVHLHTRRFAGGHRIDPDVLRAIADA